MIKKPYNKWNCEGVVPFFVCNLMREYVKREQPKGVDGGRKKRFLNKKCHLFADIEKKQYLCSVK